MININNCRIIDQTACFFNERVMPIMSQLLTKIKAIALAALRLVGITFISTPSWSSQAVAQTIERTLDEWVNEGAANEQRLTAKNRIMAWVNERTKMVTFLDNHGINVSFLGRPATALFLDNLGLSTIPPIFHHPVFSRLKALFLFNNELSSLPPEIGKLSALQILFLSNNQLTTLPPEIGQLSALKYLNLRNNRLTTLPPEIGQLSAPRAPMHEENELTHIDTSILSANNRIGQLNWMSQQLRLTNPHLDGVLAGLIDISQNTTLTELPSEFLNLDWKWNIYTEGCGFTPTVLDNIRNIANAPGYAGPFFSFSMEHMNPQTRHDVPLEQLLEELYGQVNKPYAPLKNIPCNEVPAATLQIWLARLSYMKDYNCSVEQQKQWLINNVIKYLEFADKDISYRGAFGAIITGAAEKCGDRIALSLLHLGIAYQLATIDLRDMKNLADFLARGVWAISMLETIAWEKISTLGAVDDVEVYLAYPVMLKERLHLPINVEEMHFFRYSGITQIDLDNAYEFVTEHLTNKESLHGFLVKQDKWKASLALNYPTQYADIETKKNDQTDNASPNEDYNRIEATYVKELIELTSEALSEPNEATASSS